MPTPEPAVSGPRDLAPGAIALAPHPACGPGPLRSLHARATLEPGGRLAVEFDVRGDLARLRLAPAAAAARRRKDLWQHTCFELFAGRDADTGYLEFNFAPSGDWAAWAFSDYRSGGRELEVARVLVSTLSVDSGHWRLRAQAEFAAAPDVAASGGSTVAWWLNLAAVIEDEDGALTYWAAHHSGARPDFHDRASFCVPLQAHRAASLPRAEGI
ncbi:MAG TPA: DOMON-like domain-containing protein [Steroidobacteraceae bacterium]|nr:DOMON-like domain-containing protein [Steroidobacteraceae bacterium]